MDKKFFITFGSATIAAFVGAFVAVYSFNYFQKPHDTFIPSAVAQDAGAETQLDNMFYQQQKIMEDMDKDFDNLMPMKMSRVASIRTENLKNEYKILLDLKPFNNDEKNVNIKIKDKTIEINAKYEAKNKSAFNSSEFYQSFRLPKKINAQNIKKERKDNILTITIPKTDS